jgi:putative oxidoreductase
VEDRPSLLITFIRFLVGGVFVVAGADKLVQHSKHVIDFTRWDLPSPSALVYVVGGLEVVCGVLLVIGLAPRLAALLLAIDMVGALLTLRSVDGGTQWLVPGQTYVVPAVDWVVPAVLLLLLLVLVGAGGGRWALIDRVDPAPPRRLVRE